MDKAIQVLEEANKMLADMFGIDEEDNDG
ncbi:hypothetical protein UFOVP744_1, partial [uncultured Caudovirales phage]